MMDFNRILVPVDFSIEARFALDWAIQLLNKKSNASIFLYHVSPPTPSYPVPSVDMDIESLGQRTEIQKHRLESWLDRIPSHIHSDFLIGRGAVTAEISHYCKTYIIDMIVIVAREHRGLSRWIRHHTCENIVRGATCPVLVLHHNQFNREPVRSNAELAMLMPQL